MPPFSNTLTNAFTSAGIDPTLIPGIVVAVLAGLGVLLVWSLIWKGFALWHAARNNQSGWFVVFMVINTAGLLEILYLIFWRKNKNNQVHTTVTTHTTTASTPAPDVALSEAPAQSSESSGVV